MFSFYCGGLSFTCWHLANIVKLHSVRTFAERYPIFTLRLGLIFSIFRRMLLRYVRLMSSQIRLSVVCLYVCDVDAFYAEGWSFRQYFAQLSQVNDVPRTQTGHSLYVRITINILHIISISFHVSVNSESDSLYYNFGEKSRGSRWSCKLNGSRFEKTAFSTNISLHFKNDTKYDHN